MEPDENGMKRQASSSSSLVSVARLRRELDDLMDIHSHEMLRGPDEAIAFQGSLVGDAEATFDTIRERLAAQGYTAWLREGQADGLRVVAVKGVTDEETGRPWINLVLFIATALTVLYVGTIQSLVYNEMMADSVDTFAEGIQALVVQPITHIHMGIPFAATLLGILVTHELSHYFVAQRHGSPVSLPFFIPLPLPGGLGTMGAVIMQKSAMRDRKTILDIGVAGPLGGLIVAIPLVILGLSLSEVGPIPPDVEVVVQEGNSLLYLGLKYLVFGRVLPSNGVDVWLHPVAFAAWAGLLVTMLNLLPVGQLDGGHVTYALLGERAHRLGQAVIFAMMGWGGWLLLNGNNAGGLWLVWSILNLAINRKHPPPLNSVTKLGWKRMALGILVWILFILLFMPAPMQQVVVE